MLLLALSRQGSLARKLAKGKKMVTAVKDKSKKKRKKRKVKILGKKQRGKDLFLNALSKNF